MNFWDKAELVVMYTEIGYSFWYALLLIADIEDESQCNNKSHDDGEEKRNPVDAAFYP